MWLGIFKRKTSYAVARICPADATWFPLDSGEMAATSLGFAPIRLANKSHQPLTPQRFFVNQTTMKKPVLTLARLLLAIPLLTTSHYMVYRWSKMAKLEEIRRHEEVVMLSHFVGQATFYLEKGPEQLIDRSRLLARAGLPGIIMQVEVLTLPFARQAGRAGEVARLESLVNEAHRIENQLGVRPKPAG